MARGGEVDEEGARGERHFPSANLGGYKGEMPRAGGRLVAEFGVLPGEDETGEGLVLRVGGFEMGHKGGFVRGDLLGGEGEDSSASLAELISHRNLVSGERVLGKVTRVADATGTKGFTTFLEISVRMRTDLSTVVVDHVNGFVTCHS